jgi:hypothetical protein
MILHFWTSSTSSFWQQPVPHDRRNSMCGEQTPDAGHLLSASGKRVDFVADPHAAPTDPARVYAKPDDLSHNGISWRGVLLNYNQGTDGNPLDLYPAYQLYENRIYGRLVDRIGLRNVYILSAGWGLIAADLLTPYYDITFSQSAAEKQTVTMTFVCFRMM